MSKTRIKICGITKPDQAIQLADMGVDALGLIFYGKSPRCVSVEQALRIREIIPAFVTVVGVFVDHSADEINQICTQVGLNLVQLHGQQDGVFASKLVFPYIKAIRVDSPQRIIDEMNAHINSRGFLLDTFSENAFGGTGHRINDSLLPEVLAENMILAGGINLNNIDDVLSKKPYAIDVNSGVEFSPGDKNIAEVAKIMKKIKFKIDTYG
jgi:phosphoribosylanthranilate isomerase